MMIYRDFQSRAGKYHDNLKRKLLDNLQSFYAEATDAIKVKLNKNKHSDVMTTVVEDVQVIPVIFPPLKDIPYRRINRVDGKFTLTPSNNLTLTFEVKIPSSCNVYLGDILFKIYKDKNPDNPPTVLCLEVVELLGTFGLRSLIYSKYNLTYYNQDIPSEILEAVIAIAQRREELNF